MSAPTNAELASAIQQVIARVDAREAELITWQSGTDTGGPFGDGRYPVTGLLGDQSLIKSPARLQADVDALVTTATGAVASAEAARDAAQAAQAAAEGSASGASSSAAAASGSASQAETFRNEAASHAANAEVYRDQLQAALDTIADLEARVSALESL